MTIKMSDLQKSKPGEPFNMETFQLLLAAYGNEQFNCGDHRDGDEEPYAGFLERSRSARHAVMTEVEKLTQPAIRAAVTESDRELAARMLLQPQAGPLDGYAKLLIEQTVLKTVQQQCKPGGLFYNLFKNRDNK